MRLWIWKTVSRRAVWIALCLQAFLLFWNLDLLPRWDDELFTLRVVAQEPAGIIASTRAGVHPPLYFLLVHEWLKLPLPGSALVRARAFSAVLALAATALLYALWLKELEPGSRTVFLALWALSPCLVLYGRMARSYTLQLALAIVALRLARDWFRSPSSRRSMLGYVAAVVALLYVHYLPGLAILAATALLGLWRRQWRHVLALGLIAAAYLPWSGAFAKSVALVSHSQPYWVSPNPLIDDLIRVLYTFVSFSFGETIPMWGIAAAALLSPVLLWALYRGRREFDELLPLIALVAVIGYWIATRRVAFPFMSARLLFLLPFYYLFLVRASSLNRALRGVLCAGLVVIGCAGLTAYFQKENFLNKGYLVDFHQIAREVQQTSRDDRALVLLDRYSWSAGYYLHSASFPFPIELLRDESAYRRALAAVHLSHATVIWCVRNGRDLTPGRDYERLEQILSRQYVIRRHPFVPYSTMDRWAMQWLGWRDRPTHVVDALEMRPKDAGLTAGEGGKPLL